MTNKEFASLAAQLLPHLPDMVVKVPLMICSPVREMVRGLCFERSGSDKRRFYLWVFFMPLCVPSRHVTFDLGRRLGGLEQRWNTDEPHLTEKLLFSIRAEGLPFLNNLQAPNNAAHFALSVARTNKSAHAQQTGAYMLARSGKVQEAVSSLDELLQLLVGDTSWQAEMASRAQMLKSLLLSDPPLAKKQLLAWEAETLENLGLEKFGERKQGAIHIIQ